MINEQTDVQIASRDKETDWEEVGHAHTHTCIKIQSLLMLVIQKQESFIFGY